MFPFTDFVLQVHIGQEVPSCITVFLLESFLTLSSFIKFRTEDFSTVSELPKHEVW